MKRILIIDDELAYLKLLHTQLTEHGYTVIEATNGKEGLIKAKLEKPDLILLDIRMPSMNGLTVLDELRKDPFGKTVKVIFLTNLEPDDKTIQQVVHDQPTFYLIKSDIELDDLINKIHKVLGS